MEHHRGGWTAGVLGLAVLGAVAIRAAGPLLWTLLAIVAAVAAGLIAATVAVIAYYRRPVPATVLRRPQPVHTIDLTALPPRARAALPAALEHHARVTPSAAQAAGRR